MKLQSLPAHIKVRTLWIISLFFCFDVVQPAVGIVTSAAMNFKREFHFDIFNLQKLGEYLACCRLSFG